MSSVLDLVAGSGGKGHEPGSHFTFIKESSNGTSPKFEVKDENGITWKVKLGEEVKVGNCCNTPALGCRLLCR